MPSEQHEQWKRELFSHLDRKLSGCISCEFGHCQEDHIPSHRGAHRDPTQQIMWTCERMELISEVVEIEKAPVEKEAYPPGITNRR